MIRILFINATILISFIFISNQVSFNWKLDPSNSFNHKIIYGIFGGSLGCILILFSVQVTKTSVIDYRFIPILICSISGGLTSSIISGIIIGIFRVLNFGISSASIIGGITAIIMSLGCGIIGKFNIANKKKCIYSLIFCLFSSSISFLFTMKDFILAGKSAIYFVTSSYIVCAITYYLVRYLKTSNQLINKLKDESSKDFLTGLNNVRTFDHAINTAIKNALETNSTLSILLLDIDFFKKINDTYGHPAGDSVLKSLGDILLGNCRKTDIVCRVGGEEFSVILPGSKADQAYEIGERIRHAVESHEFILPNNKKINITISVGVSCYPDITTSIDDLIKHGDNALYNAKHTGRNKVCLPVKKLTDFQYSSVLYRA